jgi:hypothetical protein
MILMSHLPPQLSPVVPLVQVVEPMLVALVQVQELQLEQDRCVEEEEVEILQVEEGCLEEAVLLVPLQPFRVEVEVALIL